MQRGTCQFCLILALFYSESVMNKFEGVIVGRFNKLSIQKNRIIFIFMKTIEIIKSLDSSKGVPQTLGTLLNLSLLYIMKMH